MKVKKKKKTRREKQKKGKTTRNNGYQSHNLQTSELRRKIVKIPSLVIARYRQNNFQTSSSSSLTLEDDGSHFITEENDECISRIIMPKSLRQRQGKEEKKKNKTCSTSRDTTTRDRTKKTYVDGDNHAKTSKKHSKKNKSKGKEDGQIKRDNGVSNNKKEDIHNNSKTKAPRIIVALNRPLAKQKRRSDLRGGRRRQQRQKIFLSNTSLVNGSSSTSSLLSQLSKSILEKHKYEYKEDNNIQGINVTSLSSSPSRATKNEVSTVMRFTDKISIKKLSNVSREDHDIKNYCNEIVSDIAVPNKNKNSSKNDTQITLKNHNIRTAQYNSCTNKIMELKQRKNEQEKKLRKLFIDARLRYIFPMDQWK